MTIPPDQLRPAFLLASLRLRAWRDDLQAWEFSENLGHISLFLSEAFASLDSMSTPPSASPMKCPLERPLVGDKISAFMFRYVRIYVLIVSKSIGA